MKNGCRLSSGRNSLVRSSTYSCLSGYGSAHTGRVGGRARRLPGEIRDHVPVSMPPLLLEFEGHAADVHEAVLGNHTHLGVELTQCGKQQIGDRGTIVRAGTCSVRQAIAIADKRFAELLGRYARWVTDRRAVAHRRHDARQALRGTENGPVVLLAIEHVELGYDQRAPIATVQRKDVAQPAMPVPEARPLYLE